ncbi:MAG: Undecaprenyl phosphate-alpha-4-amino-4-deoxy-L-arabinose arabinosyl transferase [Bacteroidota bacterium]|jgi:4-amino-4-deoxy-L-arabinose transferase-like glycosyltransferase
MKASPTVSIRDLLIIGGLALVCFLPFLNAAPLFDWDEINFAESAREMLVTGNYFQVQINFEPFWEKPPLFIWMQVLSMKVFGINAFAARLPNAIVGAITLMCLYAQGSRLRGRRFGLITTAFYFISLLPFLYFKSGIIDPMFNLLIFLGLMQIVHFERASVGEKSASAPLWAGFWIGLATLTKGPVALLVTVLVYFTWKLIWDRKNIAWMALVKFTGIYLLVILSWFGSIVLFSEDGLETVRKFIVYQAELFSQAVAGHEQPFFYHFLVFLVGCFPMSAFAFRGMGMKNLEGGDRLMRNMMTVWFWVILVLFTIVRTKIVHYSSMLYFPGTFLAAYYVDRLWSEARRPRWDTTAIYLLGFVVFGVATLSIGLIVGNIDWLRAHATNSFMEAALGAEVPWTGWEFLPGLVFVLAGILGLYFLLKARYRAFFVTFMICIPLFMNGLNALVLPRIADYSQNTAIRFFEEKAQEDAYVMVEGYKSYAHYFYGQVKPTSIPPDSLGKWLAGGPIDKPVYLVTRIDKATAEFEGWFGFFKRFESKNGFVFYKREVPARP